MSDSVPPTPFSQTSPAPGSHAVPLQPQYFVMPSQSPVRSLRGIGGATRALLLAYAVISLASLLVTGWGIVELNAYSAGTVGPDALESYGSAAVIVSGMSLIALLSTGICWLVWQRRAADAFPVGTLRRSPGWHVGSWFIPVVSAWFPFQNVSDLARASHARLGRGVLGTWWAAWLVGGLTGGLTRSFSTAHTIPSLINGLSITILMDALWIVAAIFAWIVVSRITAAIDPS